MTSVAVTAPDDQLWQPTLAMAAGPTWRPLSQLQRTELSAGAWIDHLPGWLTGADDLMSQLLQQVPWKSGSRRMYDHDVDVPRLTSHYRSFGNVPAALVAIAGERLTEHYAQAGWEPFRSAGLCLYRTGEDSVAWHGDRFGRGASKDVLVAILSLGSQRRLALRPRGGGESLSFPLSHGDLLVMGGSCQRSYDHCVPKTRQAHGPRISVQFRPSGVA